MCIFYVKRDGASSVSSSFLFYIYILFFFFLSFSFRYKRCFRMAVVEQLEFRGWEVVYVKFASLWHCV